MLNRVLWALDSEIEPQAFERLCVDFMYRAGFKDIVPVEPQDGGRDAEENPRAGRGRDGEAAFFQFSKEKDWKAKLRRDAATLATGGATFQTLVFVTLSRVRGVDRDLLVKEIREKYGWRLVVYSREWLRLQLEEAQPDLAKKYLDVDVQVSPRAGMRTALLERPGDYRLTDAWRALEAGRFERAALTLKEFMEEHPIFRGRL